MLDRIEPALRRSAAAGMGVFLILLGVGLWNASHRTTGRNTGPMPRAFRSGWFYLPMSAVGFRLLTRLWRALPVELSARQRAAALILGSLLYFPGLMLMLWGRLALGQMYDVSSGFGARLFADHRLVTSGPYALVRHPMYVGGQLAEVGAFLLRRNWATLLITLNAPVLFLRARREEEVLAAEFGAAWDVYCRQVPAWLPRPRSDA
jgi:protein-S-isoprenylcysteine O-methyltransferase Ste14